MRKIYILASFAAISIAVPAQVTVSPAGSPSNIASFLTGFGITITNVTVSCDSNAVGYFSASNNNLGIVSGLALTTGSIYNLAGPHTQFASTANNFPGDPDITSIAQMQSFDACVLEMDCVPDYDTLYFNFIFGSEEYPEFVGSSYNDAFGIFVSGPNIAGTQNMAYIPNTITPIAINNVNDQTNIQYYVDNTLSSNGLEPSYDGFTTNIQATIPVIPFGSYHIKIAVADVGDVIYDSGVFLQGGSFRTMAPTSVIDETMLGLHVNIYPQPAGGTVNFSFSGELPERVAIFNSLGGIISEQAVSAHTFAYDTDALAEGIYFARFVSGNKSYTRRFIVQKQ
jgi:hypothetical protein